MENNLPRSVVWSGMVAGTVAGSAAVLICHPLDVARTVIQTNRINEATKNVDALFFHRMRPENALSTMKSMYRGVLPPLVTQAVYKAIMFGSFNASLQYFKDQIIISNDLNVFCSGVIAGAAVSTIVAPVELIRTRLILNPRTTTLSHIAMTTKNFKQPWNLWLNILPAVLRDGPGVGFYFVTYEKLKNVYADRNSKHSKVEIPLYYRIFAASCAGISFWIWALPIDTVKTRVEAELFTVSNSSSMLFYQNVVKLWVNGGITHFYKSWLVAFGRGIPSAAVTLTTYDIVSKALE